MGDQNGSRSSQFFLAAGLPPVSGKLFSTGVELINRKLNPVSLTQET